MKQDQEFAVRMEKTGKTPDGDEKYAIIGFFREKKRAENRTLNAAADKVVPPVIAPVATVANTPAAQKSSAMITPTVVMPTTPAGAPTQVYVPTYMPAELQNNAGNILASSRAEQWLLAFIAFLLFINLICKS